MPNWVTNQITFAGNPDDVRRLIDFVKGENETFDFNKIIPMPESLMIESGSRGERGLKAYQEYMRKLANETTWVGRDRLLASYVEKFSDDMETWLLGKQYYENRLKYGHATWYSWANENWGTKWNACDSWVGESSASFNTAWSAPFPVLLKLSQLFPDVIITLDYADEDIGQNCGGRMYKAGIETDRTPFAEEGSDDAIRFACDIVGYDYDEYIAEIAEN